MFNLIFIKPLIEAKEDYVFKPFAALYRNIFFAWFSKKMIFVQKSLKIDFFFGRFLSL
jgi:hypothetical protein